MIQVKVHALVARYQDKKHNLSSKNGCRGSLDSYFYFVLSVGSKINGGIPAKLENPY
jgi:hypothetical protein